MITGHDIAIGLRTAYMRMHRQTLSVLSEFDFTPLQFVLLASLCEEDGISQQELTERATSDANTVRASLVLLERKGVLVRRSDKEDRRARRVMMTAKGRRVFAELSAELKPLQEMLLSSFNRGEAKAMVDGLSRIAEAMSQAEQRV